MWTSPQVPTIHRFNSVKKGMAAFKDLRKAWEKWIVSRLTEKASPRLYSIDGDMFFSCVDLYQVAQISYVDLAKRAKFVPAQ
jgi:hypothetical protein